MKVRFAAAAIFVFTLFAASVAYGQETNEITEITMEMSPGSNAPLPELSITFRKDGTASYKGGAGVKEKGKHKAAITPAEFGQLAELMQRRKFNSLKYYTSQFANSASDPSFPAFSAATVTIGAVINGKRKTVTRTLGSKIDTTDGPPKELLEIEGAIWNLFKQAKWEKDKK